MVTLALVKGKGMKKVQKASETCAAMTAVPFGAIYLEMEFTGSANVSLADQEFDMTATDLRHIRHQVLLSDATPVFALSDMSEDFVVKRITVRVVEF